MRTKWNSAGSAPWLALLAALPIGFAIGCCTKNARTETGVPRNLPRHLLGADCVEQLDIPDDDSADPLLVAGCDDAARSAFFRKIIASTVIVSVGGFPEGSDRLAYSGGTGVVIGDDGSILTAYHVIDDAVSVTVGIQELSADGQSVTRVRDVPVDVIAFSAEKDVALLRPKRKVPMPPPLPIRLTLPAAGELVWHFGKTTTWASGTVENPCTESIGKKPVVQAHIRGNQGDSGGPFVSAAGELLGVMLSVSDDKRTSYFMSVAEALSALHHDPDAGVCTKP